MGIYATDKFASESATVVIKENYNEKQFSSKSKRKKKTITNEELLSTTLPINSTQCSSLSLDQTEDNVSTNELNNVKLKITFQSSNHFAINSVLI